MLDNIRELTYIQLENRIELLLTKYESYLFCINISKEYDPRPILNKNTFDFPHEEPDMLCYTAPRPYERCSSDTVYKEYRDLCRLSRNHAEQKIIIVDNTKTYSVSGVYVDERNKLVVLLNGYYDGQPVDWSELKDNIY